MSSVFLSYRRLDTAGHAGRLHDALTEHFGPDQVFQDYEDIEAGSDFVQAIEAAVAAASVLVVVIGDQWLTMAGPDGRRRLDVPDDVVRLEVATALARGIQVIPVLVEGAKVPSAQELPYALAALHRCNALEISDSRWKYDVGRLLERLEKVPGLTPITALQRVPLTRATWRPWLHQQMTPRRILRAGVATFTLLGTVLGVYWGLQPFFQRSPGPHAMTGDFNIAVAEFGAADTSGRVHESEAGRELAQSLSDRLVVELQAFSESGFDLQVRLANEFGALAGATPQERARAAEMQSRRIKADLIIFGVVHPAGSGTSFTPEFYLSPQKLPKAEELGGQHDLGAAVRTSADFAHSVVARKELRDRLLGRTGALANFVLGLSYYAAERLEDAGRYFEAARAAPGWDDADGKEVLNLFLGNVAGKLNDLGSAEAHFARALELQPEYARAQVGMASVLFQRARGSCEAGEVDIDGLMAALQRFQRAPAARVQSPLADVAAKSAFGEGQVYLCLSQALIGDYWLDAERAFEHVIAAYGGKNERLRSSAAEAHANLGFIQLPSADEPDAADRYRRALAEYELAIQLTPLDDRRAFFHGQRGFILERLGDRPGAMAAYQEAVRLEPDQARRKQYEARLSELERSS